MNVVEYLQHFIGALHAGYETALTDLNAERLQFRASPDTNHIAFTAWHWVRTEDNIVNFVLQRKQTVWLEEGLHEKWHLPKVAQGTGMDRAEAHALTLPSAEQFLDYAHKVWTSSAPYIGGLTSEEWSRIVKVVPFGEIPVLQVLGQTLVAHGNQHLGEIWLLRELQGLAGIGF